MAHTLSAISCDTDHWDTNAEVWNVHVGGYQVCQKWLKDRKGRVLSFEDIQHYQRVVAALAETIELMGRIDGAIEEHGGGRLSERCR